MKYSVYHGSKASFMEFDPSKIDRTSEGKGFYFSDSINLAKGYGDIIYKATITIQKPILNQNQKTITKAKLNRIFLELLKLNPDALSNYGDIEFEGKGSVLRQAIDIEYGVPDLDLIGSLINGGISTYRQIMIVIKELTGYDGAIVNRENDKVYVVFLPEQIKIISCYNELEKQGIIKEAAYNASNI